MKITSLFVLLSFNSLIAFGQWSITLNPGSDKGIDAHVNSQEPTRNYGAGEGLIVYNSDKMNKTFRSYLNFDLSILPGDAVISSALLSLYYNPYNGWGSKHYGDNSFEIWRVTTSWSEFGISWNNQPTATSYHKVTVPATNSGVQDLLDIDVTQLVQDMIDDPISSFGFLLRFYNESGEKWLMLSSSDHSKSFLWPKLDIEYTSVSINDNKSPEALKVYPTLIRNTFKISIQSNNIDFPETKIYDIQGKIILDMTGTFYRNGSYLISDVNLNDYQNELKNGLYVIKVTNRNSTWIKKILINR